ncbi:MULTISPECIES: FtsX-like permease family protein [unclassified Helicobacter]|uniref:FtsX-like permease family protein n=1 Tax=unclassified Helicobacter TaxID=2593540 RepID=UPI000CF0C5C8|nr:MULTISPECIES: FtsX-like permease family protein [unclassified Helicobacter]
MNTLKRHLALIIPLLALLFSLQSILLINRAITIKEDKLLQNYFILVASKQTLTLNAIQKHISNVSMITPLDPSYLLQKFQDYNDEENLKIIKKDLPFFYSIKLSHYPNHRELDLIEKSLKALDTIIHIETFSKTHNQVYKLLFLTKGNVLIFASLLGIFSILLMMRQIQVWRFEHQKRMQIMDLLGASSWLKNKILFKLAFFDSIIASCIILSGSFYLSNLPQTQDVFEDLGIQTNIFNFTQDFFILASFAICISFFSVFAIIFSQRKI